MSGTSSAMLTADLSLITGTGFVVAGLVTSRYPMSGAQQRWVARGLLATGGLALLVPVLHVTGWDRGAYTLAAACLAIALPQLLLRVIDRPAETSTPAALIMQLLAACLWTGGAAMVAGTALGAVRVIQVGGGVAGVAAFGFLWAQFELTAGDDRRRVLWLMLGIGFSAPATWLFVATDQSLPFDSRAVSIVAGFLCLPIPVTAGLALAAPRRFDVRLVISRSVVLTVMITACVAVFAGVAALIELAQGHPAAPGLLAVLATVLAAGFHPVLVRIQVTMDELLFGGRADPVATLTQLGSQLTAGASPPEWLDMLRRALAVPAVILRHDGAVIATSGDPGSADVVTTPLQVGDVAIGELEVALPGDQLRLSSTTQAVLHLVAAPLAQALHAAALTEQVQTSRGRVVAALEDERRRMRRDLHDGLGPTLTGIAYSADAAANLIGVDAAQAAGLLKDLRSDAGEAIAEVRRIVYGLRPRALDELGLVGAVRQRVSRLGTVDGQALVTEIVAPDLPELPAAVEVVAYRVAVEAVTNVARHAGVAQARLEFSVADGDSLQIQVDDAGSDSGADSGAGPGSESWPNWTLGVGLTSMRERVEQIGGVLDAGPGPAGGRVRARIPIRLGAE